MVFINLTVSAACSYQISRIGNIGHVVGQLIGNANGEADGGVMRDQFELVVDIGLAICAVARVDGSAAGLKVTGSVAGRLSTRGHLDQFFGRVARDGVLVLIGTAFGFVLEVDGLSCAKSAGIAQCGVLSDFNRFYRIPVVKAHLMEHQFEGLDLLICVLSRNV